MSGAMQVVHALGLAASQPCPDSPLPASPSRRSPCSYYAYWERRLFAAVSAMVVSGLQAFHARLAACRPTGAPASSGLLGQPEEVVEDDGSGQAGKPPLFRVSAGLHAARLLRVCMRSVVMI